MRAKVIMVCAVALGGCMAADEVRGFVVVADAPHALSAADLRSLDGSYGPGCSDRTGSWSIEIESGAPLRYERLSVVRNDATCALTIDALVADELYTAAPALEVGAAYQAVASAFEAGGAIAFHANARLDAATFASDFVITILSSDDVALHGTDVSAQQMPPSFAVLAATTVTSTGLTVVTGELGVTAGGAATGFPPGVVNGGTIQIGGAQTVAAQGDAATTYADLVGATCNEILTGQDLGGLTLTPDIYCYGTTAQLTGALTLDAQGDPAAVFVIQIGTTLITAANAVVNVIGSGSPCNVYFLVGSSATLGADANISGKIVAHTSITLGARANVSGAAWALEAAVTMDSNTVSSVGCPGGPM